MKELRYYAFCDYLKCKDAMLFTMALLPYEGGKFPSVIIRTPYEGGYVNETEEKLMTILMKDYEMYLKRGYAVAFQHCRGTGKSSGDFIPYQNERDDTRGLYDWVRQSSFYNGEIYLLGLSYLSTVHYAAAPYGDDIKGAVFEVQDTNRYNLWYRNGVFKVGLHGNYHMNMYKHKSIEHKNFTQSKSFNTLPLSALEDVVYGEKSAEFAKTLKEGADPKAEIWNTPMGGVEYRDAVKTANFPILLTTGFYDIYTGGIFDMWNDMPTELRKKSAMIVTPHEHNDRNNAVGITFKNGKNAKRSGRILR